MNAETKMQVHTCGLIADSMATRRVVASCLLAMMTAFSSLAFAQDSNRRDGNWWRTQDRGAKVNYIIGFFDGMDLGRNFSTWKLSESIRDQRQYTEAVLGVSASYGSYVNKYFANVKSGQLADGLDVFYSDYRNRQITIDKGAWIVVQTIAGEPPGEEVLNNWRRNP